MKKLILDLNTGFFANTLRLFVIIIGSYMIGSDMFKEKTYIGWILFSILIASTFLVIMIQVIVFLATEQYKKTSNETIQVKDDIIAKYVDLVTEYKTTLHIQNKKIKKLKKVS